MIYADNAATTKMSKAAIDAMLPYMEEYYGNPSSLYAFGQQAKEALENARSRIAACLRAQAAPDKIICLHDGRGRRHAPARTIEALRELLPLWIAEGWQFDTIDKLYLPQSAQQAQTADLSCGLSIQSEKSEGCGR